MSRLDKRHAVGAEVEFLAHVQLHALQSGDWSYTDSLPRPSRLHRFLEGMADADPLSVGLECDDKVFSYRDLDILGNRLAHLLLRGGVASGDAVGILIERSLATYVAILGVLKAGAAYVPIDPTAPADRVRFIAGDAGIRVLLTTADKNASSQGLSLDRILLDDPVALLGDLPEHRPDLPDSEDTVAYVIYTSGSTGRPKGVAVPHSSICNFIAVASQVYAVRPQDRVYQGLSVSFDFSIEEIWTTWAVGAALIAGPTDGRNVGAGLAEFLEQERITFFHGVPHGPRDTRQPPARDQDPEPRGRSLPSGTG